MEDLRKYNKGRPKMTDEEKIARKKIAVATNKKKADVKNISLTGELLQKLNNLREKKSKEFGFTITHAQLIHILINQAE
jgi:hypothetical protein